MITIAKGGAFRCAAATGVRVRLAAWPLRVLASVLAVGPTWWLRRMREAMSSVFVCVPELVTLRLPNNLHLRNANVEKVDCPHHETDLHSWHSLSTWPRSAPVEGANVTIPEGKKVLLQQPLGMSLAFLTVPRSSELIIGPNSTHPIELRVAGIFVEGALRIGAQSCRLDAPVTVTLHGRRPMDKVGVCTVRTSPTCSDPPPFLYKGIYVLGTLEVHGKQYFDSWTRLARTLRPGDQSLYVQAYVNWEPGQQLVVTTTELKDSRDFNRNEVFTIAEVSLHEGMGSYKITLQEKAKYLHQLTAAFSPEVGLLTRKIKFQGAAEDSEPTDTDVGAGCRGSVVKWSIPCPDKYLTGFGGHVMIAGQGVGRLSGVEFYRMGQTNVLARYPIHFHLMGDARGLSFVRDCSVHRSFYRCVTIHGTHNVTVSQNVAYDVIGSCYYLEDGVEQDNVIEYNLGALIHVIGEPAGVGPGVIGQDFSATAVTQTETLTNPADATASAFYLTNAHNRLVGNAASGGWAGYAFPGLERPIKEHRHLAQRPSSAIPLEIDGNSAHSSGYWWEFAAAFYVGGKIFHPNTNSDELAYNPGKHQHERDTCTVICNTYTNCICSNKLAFRVTNTVVFRVWNIGFNHWGTRAEIVRYETHDVGLSANIMGQGFLDQLLLNCRTGEPVLPADIPLDKWRGTGFVWYDTNMWHIVTNVTFRQCGSPQGSEQGCGEISCHENSTVWGMLSHSDLYVPQFMQATASVRYEACGRRFRMNNFLYDIGSYLNNGMNSSTSERLQCWLDADGSASGTNHPTLLASTSPEAGNWWQLDRSCIRVGEGVLWACERSRSRMLGSVLLKWDERLQGTFSVYSEGGVYFCANGKPDTKCEPEAYANHWGRPAREGIPLTLSGQLTGALGGFGWHVAFNKLAPRLLSIERRQVSSATSLMLSIAYPPSTTGFTIVAKAPSWCNPSNNDLSCSETFSEVDSVVAVRFSSGNTYHWDGNLLYLRVVQPLADATGKPDWQLVPDEELGEYRPFEHYSIQIPRFSYSGSTLITAHCSGGGLFCDDPPRWHSTGPFYPQPCEKGFTLTAYDQCCFKTTCVSPLGASQTSIRIWTLADYSSYIVRSLNGIDGDTIDPLQAWWGSSFFLSLHQPITVVYIITLPSRSGLSKLEVDYTGAGADVSVTDSAESLLGASSCGYSLSRLTCTVDFSGTGTTFLVKFATKFQSSAVWNLVGDFKLYDATGARLALEGSVSAGGFDVSMLGKDLFCVRLLALDLSQQHVDPIAAWSGAMIPIPSFFDMTFEVNFTQSTELAVLEFYLRNAFVVVVFSLESGRYSESSYCDHTELSRKQCRINFPDGKYTRMTVSLRSTFSVSNSAIGNFSLFGPSGERIDASASDRELLSTPPRHDTSSLSDNDIGVVLAIVLPIASLFLLLSICTCASRTSSNKRSSCKRVTPSIPQNGKPPAKPTL
ncbi:hypothetical protein AB1Y20_020738 [Prymnesium parvum]|uniref:G8 domain-containing protein n=1 Tax=Prymnesium parvum TaxID=97485 RepID=A0AB34JYB9_PRYPA